ncbi:MAG: T9SS type A sorting domain-containing protein [Flavobacteriales bacterium]|nr:T9SS type A sorting domain-containing protein [Flavobacteriales bacterium]
MKRPLLSLVLLLLFGITANAQNRYFGEVFSSVSVAHDVVYGNNLSVLTGSPVAQDLHMDIYTPDGDTVSARPVVLVVHDGEMISYPYNQECVGNKDDAHIVELCTRLAKYGYVVAAVDYRLGWNPAASQQSVRTSTYINALYRGMQDVRNAVRFFRWSADNGNPYAVNADKISVIGEGTGAELAVWTGAFDRYEEMDMPKFLDPSTLNILVDSAEVGNVYGTQARPLNLANYPTYSSEVSFIGSLGGAVGDSTWIEVGEPPIVSMHCPSNPFVPFGFGAVIVSVTGDFLINVSGSRDVQRISGLLGNNQSYVSAMLSDPVSQIANSNNGGYKGLYPLIRPTVESSPWQWWDVSCPNHTQASATNSDMSETKGQAYIDTIMAYMAPRMALANGFINSGVGIEEYRTIELGVYPNPTSDVFTVSWDNNSVHGTLQVYNMLGELVHQQPLNGSSSIRLQATWPAGAYHLVVVTEEAIGVKRLVVTE